jgi:thiamine-phosphate pyrophosphorylase
MRFIVITPSKNVDNEYGIVSHMLNNGLPALHVRKPGFSKEELVNYIEHFTDEQQSKMVLHSHHNILLDYDLKGIHMSRRHRRKHFQSWLTLTKIEMRMNRKISVSSSSKSLSSMADNYKTYEYVMLTPVFTDPQGHRPSFSPLLLQQVLRSFPDKIVARGGADAESIEKARDLGFSGVAFHNFFWSHEDPIKEFNNVMERFNSLGITIQ